MKNVKMTLVDDEGNVTELEGESIVFYLVKSRVEKEDTIDYDTASGVFGPFSIRALMRAKENILDAIANCETGKHAQEKIEEMDMSSLFAQLMGRRR